MAMILEVLDPRGGVRVRVRVQSLPFTIGRAYDNDLILDDPYADAHHARVVSDDAGALVVEDLGSRNGLLEHSAQTRLERVPANGGGEVRVGNTVLRFRDPAEPVPPALPVRAPRAPATGPDFLESKRWRLAVILGSLPIVAAWEWLGNYSRSPWNDVASTVLGLALLGAFWAGGWALAGRIVQRSFRFGVHYAVFCVAFVILLSLGAVVGWLTFLFPGSELVTPVSMVVWFGLTTVLLATHLRHASALDRFRRWRGALVTTGVIYALGGALALVGREPFTDVPTFSGVTRPLAARWIPTTTIEAFTADAAELQRQVDELAAE